MSKHPPQEEPNDETKQLVLFSGGEQDGGIDVESTVGNYTGERIKEREPKKYELIINLLAGGVGMLRIAKLVGSSPHTIKAIRDAEGLAISDEKKRISGSLRDFARMAVDRMIEEADSIPVAQLPVAVGIAIDKMQVLDGEPNKIIGSGKEVTPIEKLNAFVDGLRNVTPATGTGLGGEKAAVKEGEFEDLGAPEGPSGGATDSGSVDKGL